MSIDCHIHLSERKDDKLIPFAKKNGYKYTLEELIAIMKNNGTVKGLLLSPPVSLWHPCPNEVIIRLTVRSRGMLFPIVTVESNSSSVADGINIATRNSSIVKGFKILLGYERVYPSEKAFTRLYDYCEEHLLPVFFHTGDTANSSGSLMHSNPINLDELANSRPELKIVACHFGNPWIMEVAELVYKHGNVYADLSGLFAGGEGRYFSRYFNYLAKKISEAIYYMGHCDRILFGSDYPVSNPSKILELVKNLDITQRDRSRILYRNAKELFRI